MDSEREAVRGRALSSMRSREVLLFASAVIFVALLLGAFASAAQTDLVTCGGDGGSPFAAPASPRGKYCDSGLPTISITQTGRKTGGSAQSERLDFEPATVRPPAERRARRPPAEGDGIALRGSSG